MKSGIALLAALLIGVHAYADNPPASPAKSKRDQLLEQCLSKQAANDPANTTSKRQRTATCKKQIRAHKRDIR